MSAIVTDRDRQTAYDLKFDGIRLHQGHLNVIAQALAATRAAAEGPLLDDIKWGKHNLAQAEAELAKRAATADIVSRAAELLPAQHAEKDARIAELELLAESAEDDCQRAITARQKADHDLKCLEESTVDKKAFEQLKAERDRLREALAKIAFGVDFSKLEAWELRSKADNAVHGVEI